MTSKPATGLSVISERIGSVRDHYLLENLVESAKEFLSDNLTKLFLSIFLFMVLMAVIGPMITPYTYDQAQYGDDGQLLRAQPPSSDYLFGTTYDGYDVLSRVLYGARVTILTGLLGGTIIVGLGLVVGVSAGYFGGWVDDLLMRVTDFVYGIPFIPTAIVIIAYLGVGFWSAIMLIGLLLWRGNARVFRSHVLQIKEREHVIAAKLLGASDLRIIFGHILPNMGGMIMLFYAIGTGFTIIITASLAFLGFMNPFLPSWGVMLRNAYQSAYMGVAWWWTMAPAVAILLTVLSIFMLGRGYERVQQTAVGE